MRGRTPSATLRRRRGLGKIRKIISGVAAGLGTVAGALGAAALRHYIIKHDEEAEKTRQLHWDQYVNHERDWPIGPRPARYGSRPNMIQNQ